MAHLSFLVSDAWVSTGLLLHGCYYIREQNLAVVGKRADDYKPTESGVSGCFFVFLLVVVNAM